MSPKWYFREYRPGDNLSDPDFTKALFAQDAESPLARSVVRESIQNSLDARAEKETAVTVRFVIRTGSSAPAASSVAPFLEGAWEHLVAPKAGLDDIPAANGAVPFLAVEDFGTKGLTGDPAQWDPFESERNAFFLFYRALGKSGKTEEDRGRWGVGKFVFPLASRAHCLLGYSATAKNGPPLLMGRMVLKTHQVSGRSYHPDGHWGERTATSDLVMPVTATPLLDSFRKTFSLRRTNEPGLSVVVPWLATELTAATLTKAVVKEYFLPILRSELLVEIDNNGSTEKIDAARVEAFARQIEPPELRARLALAVQAATWPANQMTQLRAPITFKDSDWEEDFLTEESRKSLLHELDAGRPIAVRVPVLVQKTGAVAGIGSYFDIFMQNAEGVGRQRPLIVREGITVSKDKTGIIQNHIALIIVDDRALAGFIGDAETPAHNELQIELVKNKYSHAPRLLRAVRDTAAALHRALEQTAVADDNSILANFFPIEDPDEAETTKPVKEKKGKDTPSGPVVDLPFGSKVRINRIPGGFRIQRNASLDAYPEEIAVKFAYDVRRGSPFRRYNPLDFSLLKKELAVIATGVDVIDERDNRIVVRPFDPDFALEVSGFDPLRDLVVRADTD